MLQVITKEETVRNIADYINEIAESVPYIIGDNCLVDVKIINNCVQIILVGIEAQICVSIDLDNDFKDMEYQDYEEVTLNVIADEFIMFNAMSYFDECYKDNETWEDLKKDTDYLFNVVEDLQYDEKIFYEIGKKLKEDFKAGKLYHKNKQTNTELADKKVFLESEVEKYLDSVNLPKKEIDIDVLSENDFGYFTLVAENDFDLVVILPKEKELDIAELAKRTALDFDPEKAFDNLWKHDYYREDGWTVKKVIDMLYDAKSEFDKKILAK